MKKHGECLLLDNHIYYYSKSNVFAEVNSQKLGHLLSKLLRYDYLAENYKLALQKQAIPFGLTL